MQYEGHLAGGVVVFDHKSDLPDGTRVRIVPIGSPQSETFTEQVHKSSPSSVVQTGAQVIEYYQRERLIGTRGEITDSQAHARVLREAAETRARP